ncbi:bacillithiol biosynthesis cysteine-adding enzyme BshC [Parapedobacter sp. 10938]|uniref:bacillithiol biosynthesis cysteine-adding enzyme BshC n=1 Tax=Parapedobacter flavus TaxID=3110225 RepID=UPI002DB7DAE1|nr:bacillithiol biosynthesis cysteine-adding enzyme BshC [Parapedobacter sp. 10938]MEC3880799.1 bacillithiol biosynthesis cysteine-adding enzyme BshC [Parapedobacter sp. 10938]
MKATYIDYKDTNSFSKTLLAYLADAPALAPFAGNRPTLDGFARQIEAKTGKTDRTELVQVLRRQYGHVLAERSAVTANISALADERTFTVTTGHQLNIFTGPLYFIFKIASTIRLARDLKAAFPDYHFVPVYWMATEDHDFAEINHTRLHGKKIVWDTPAVGATGRMKTAGMDDTVQEYQRALGLSDNSSKLATLVRTAYLQHDNLADATRSLVDGLFGAHGLVIIDADEASLKQRFAAFIERDILGGHSHDAIEQTSVALQAAGFASQVHAREINFFYLTDTFRERIVKLDDGRFEVLNQGLYFSEDELKAEIHRHPERFSPNVVMRPLYQEVILPNLAYIGGGAEIAYWLQLKSVFEHFDVDFPILVPRNSAMITDDNMSVKVLRLNLTFRSIFKDTEELKKEYVRRHTKHRLTLNDEWMELNAIFSKLRLRAHKIDPSLGPSTDAVKARLKKAINNLEKKLLKADKRNHEDALIQIDRIKEKLFPGGVLQERSENMGPLYVRYGDRLIEELIQHFSPLDFKFTIIY